MKNEKILNFLNQYDYDIRKTHNARWIDQKCTYDVVSIIADCIINFLEENKVKSFTVKDIWNSEYTRENVMEIFSKPDTLSKKAQNEYNKYFGQPIKLLAYSKILNEVKKEKGNGYIYFVNNLELLEYIALRETNSLKFLITYIEKVLKDSDIYDDFKKFFEKQNKNAYDDIKERFSSFTIENTNITKELECNRIFTKIINPLAFTYKKLGTEDGRLSKTKITLNDLAYNKVNWRDEYTNKDKSITRNEYKESTETSNSLAYNKYTLTKAKRQIRKFNDLHYNGISEVLEKQENIENSATQIHHIFSVADYPSISTYLENLIALTPNQHYLKAHPNNKTQKINKDFQYICLIAKLNKIYINLSLENNQKKLYDFEDYKFVLNTGLETEVFSTIEYLDFVSILQKIDYFYSDFKEFKKFKENNKNLIQLNYPNFI